MNFADLAAAVLPVERTAVGVLMPPLSITDAELEKLVSISVESVKAAVASPA